MSVLNRRDAYLVKATYYAFGHNDCIDELPGLSKNLKADAVTFGRLYAEQFCEAENVISVQECFRMFLAGKKVFKRE
jgi:hypothetical protein